ncbi:MAG TPA: RNA 2',3'-cyclic phosphodiesterase [Candidatus Acidoferrales bacterium]|nr:RNA 2',3'-cyclic phosphodiesterase [Candidatus Acidoferrales bacterium]
MRLFAALDFPEAIRDAIRALVSRLKPLAKDARWVRVEGMHVTLKFIGYAEPEQREQIVAALALIRSNAPVEMRFRGLGFFPTERRPRVFWCGIDASPNLAELAAHIERALLPLGVATEQRAFVPHLTLARFDSSHGLGELVRMSHQIQSLDLGATREGQFHLFESVLKRSGAEYTKLRSFSFAKEPA